MNCILPGRNISCRTGLKPIDSTVQDSSGKNFGRCAGPRRLRPGDIFPHSTEGWEPSGKSKKPDPEQLA